jgi:acyl-CoA synthetase (AMP-forming)/AMP-acid ligase II
MREDGYCNVVGRSKDMVIGGGENIDPREIEEFLYGAQLDPGAELLAVLLVGDADDLGAPMSGCW